MKTFKRIVLTLIVLLLIGAGAYLLLNRSDDSPGQSPLIAGAPASTSQLARGEYLTKAADCIACHTVPGGGKAFAGGVAFKLPFGTIYSSNITADKTTGIGNWSDDQFVRAVREGIRNDGAHLYPAFPYTSYTALSRDDVLAIKAYLFSLPTVTYVAPANQLSFPFDQRWAMGFWNAAFFKSQRFEADPGKSAQWNAGAYLATALGHCAECHTPRNFAFAMRRSDDLAGEELQGWQAYNITSDKTYGIGAWSDQQLTDYLRSGHADGRGSASGPMGEVVAYSLQHLTPEDTAALVSYLRDVPARRGDHPISIDAAPAQLAGASNAAPAADELKAANDPGFQLFAGACASCHQWNGIGQQSSYASLAGTRGVNDPSGINVSQIILNGANFHVDQHEIFMPEFGRAYSDAEIAALSNYVIRHFGNKTGTLTPGDIAKRREL
jgi:mono/diheme cytochrome c family protein